MSAWSWPLLRHARSVRPDIVVALTHGYLWTAAPLLASRLSVPLALILHDHWPDTLAVPRWAKAGLVQQLGRAYRAAAARFCVCPEMESFYRQQYGFAGAVLYPMRGEDGPPARLRYQPRRDRPFTVAYIGSFYFPQYLQAVCTLADLLAEKGGELQVYSSALPSALVGRSNVRYQGFLALEAIAERLSGRVDLLFCPMSFAEDERRVMETCFPSKLSDYSALGIPILIWAPAYASAVQWARRHGGIAFVVTDAHTTALKCELERIQANPEECQHIAQACLDRTADDFAPDRNRQLFLESLRAASCIRCA
jgi:glycosyltransferase involved in cell wall biosynthesis